MNPQHAHAKTSTTEIHHPREAFPFKVFEAVGPIHEFYEEYGIEART